MKDATEKMQRDYLRYDQLHCEAMRIADQGDAAEKRGESAIAQSLYREAYEKERAAIEVHAAYGLESCILWRSAAYLALNAGDVANARYCAERALPLSTSFPAIRDDLRALIRDPQTRLPARAPASS